MSNPYAEDERLAIQCSTLSQRVQIGILSKDKRTFLRRRYVTEDATVAVAQSLLGDHDHVVQKLIPNENHSDQEHFIEITVRKRPISELEDTPNG